MAIEVHPEAAKRADDLGIALPAMLHAYTPGSSAPDRGFATDIPSQMSIGPHDIKGPIISRQPDRFGREIARFMSDENGVWGLSGDSYAAFAKVVRILHSQRSVRGLVSEETIRTLVFHWAHKRRFSEANESLVANVLSELEKLIEDVMILVPLHGLVVEEPFQLGNVEICQLTAAEIDRWQKSAINHAKEQEAQVTLLFTKVRKKFQGRAAARFTTRAEREYAITRAFAETELSVSVLRLFSVGVFFPERPTNVARWGAEYTPRQAFFLIGPDDALVSGESFVHGDDIEPWALDSARIRKDLPRILGHWSALLTKEQRSEFEQAALRSMVLYSRATEYRNISEKLIHIFSAVESLLLRNDNEPISAAIADRLAFAVGTDADKRLAIARNLRDVYAMRSQFVHHALETTPNSEDLHKLETFLVTISQLFINLGVAMATHSTKSAFLDDLEKRKYT